MRPSKLLATGLVALAAITQAPTLLAAEETSTAFDGLWDVMLTCPPHHDDDDAKGYTHRFPAEVKGGLMQGTYGKEGEPGWHLLTGPIAAQGKATLKLDGIVSNADYAVNGAQRGKAYSYRVRAQFEGTSGTGQRVGKRKCDFAFKHR